MTFDRDAECRDCDLWETCKNVCISTRQHTRRRGQTRAILIVGEAPGRNEDAQCKPFVGESGAYLDDWIDAGDLLDHADIYLSNAIRCRLPSKQDPSIAQLRACQKYLIGDVRSLQRQYEEVVILCVGTTATRSIYGDRLTKCFKRQGELVTLADCRPCRVFCTYHPAKLMPGRSPSDIDAVADHILLLNCYLRGALDFYKKLDTDLRINAPPPRSGKGIPWLGIDIETYGILKGMPKQRVFHPQRSIHTDGCPQDQLIQTVSVTYRKGKGLHHAEFIWEYKSHRIQFRRWLQWASKHGIRLLFKNAQFDVQFLRTDGFIKPWLCQRRQKIFDLDVTSYLTSDVRPERGLKALAVLLGVSPPWTEREFKQYDRADDPKLLLYNRRDAENTLKCQEVLEERIREEFKGSAKLSRFCLDWYNNVLWLTIYMAEDGICYDRRQLNRLLHRHTDRMEKLKAIAKSRGLILQGTGSKKSTLALLENTLSCAAKEEREDKNVCGRIYERDERDPPGHYGDRCVPQYRKPHQFTWDSVNGLWTHPELQFTDKLAEVSTGDENINLLTNLLPRSSLNRKLLKILQRYRGSQKLVGTYLMPLLKHGNKSKKWARLIDGKMRSDYKRDTVLIKQRKAWIAYPTWYPCPQESKHDDDQKGGTCQARIVCKCPAAQTTPRSIKNCITTRFVPGYLLEADLSQIELRVAALLSGDRRMLKEYQEGVDRHTLTAERIFGPEIRNHHAFYDIYRHAAKTTNFLILYRGGGRTLQEMLLREVGLELPVEECYGIVHIMQKRYPELWAWQEELIRKAQRDGYLETPFVGQGRLFHGSAECVEQTYTPTICDLLVQAVAADLMLDSQRLIRFEIEQRGLRAHSGLNTYDSLIIECPVSERTICRNLIDSYLTRPPLLTKLERHLGRSVPVLYDYKETFRSS